MLATRHAPSVVHALPRSARAVGSPVWASGCASVPLAALAGGALAGRFHAWRGASGRRYVCSIFLAAWAAEIPFLTDPLVLGVAVDSDGRRSLLFVSDGGLPSRRLPSAIQAMIAEYHVHLLAETAAQRMQAYRDLAEALLRPPARLGQVRHEPSKRRVAKVQVNEMLVGVADVGGVVAGCAAPLANET